MIFIGEEGEDTGGLRREFWRLFASEAAQQYCIGDTMKTFQQNVPALQVGVWLHIDNGNGMSLCHFLEQCVQAHRSVDGNVYHPRWLWPANISPTIIPVYSPWRHLRDCDL